MPRTRRYIFNTLTVVSLLLMLATVGLWVRSYIMDPIKLMCNEVRDARILG